MRLSAIRALAIYQGLLTLVVIGMAAKLYLKPFPTTALLTDNDGAMHVRGLVVEDASGKERVRLGAPLPNPLKNGKRAERRGSLSGILITDATGTERGGYVTEDQGEAFLTLDSRKGQEMTLLSNASGGVNFDITDPDGNEATITVFPEGPHLQMKKANRVVVDLPLTQATSNAHRQTRSMK